MKQCRLMFFFILLTKYGFSQTKSIDLGIGTGVGSKLFYGDWGLYVDYIPSNLNNKVEFLLGAGIKNDFAFGGGVKIKLFQIKKFETLIGLDYSYQTAGLIRREKIENHVDYYKISKTQIVNCYLTERFFLNTNAAVLISCGYGQNISGYTIYHIAGPHENDGQVKKYMGSGLMVEVGFVVFFKPMYKKDE